MFTDNKTLVLNHRKDAAVPHPNHKPGPIRVRLKDNVSGGDDPLFSERSDRDGWHLTQEWKVENRGYPKMFLTTQPEIRTKQRPGGAAILSLKRSIHGLHYSEQFKLLDGHSLSVTLGDASWADWDQQGRLVFAAGGRIMTGALTRDGNLEQHLLLDLNSSKPTAIVAPDWAAHW